MTITGIFIFLLFILLANILLNLWRHFRYKKKLREFAQLKQIYRFFCLYGEEKIKEAPNLPNGVVLEDGWLYSDYFYFDLEDGQAMVRFQKYFIRYLQFFVKYGNQKNNREIFHEIMKLRRDICTA